MEFKEKSRFSPEIKEEKEKEPRDSEDAFLEFQKLAKIEKRGNEEVNFAEVRKFTENGVIYFWEVKFQGEKEEIMFIYQKYGDYQGFENEETGKIEGKCSAKVSVILKESESSHPEHMANYDGEKWVEV